MPSSAVELPGEANPLTEHTLLNTLQAASSNNPIQIQSGTKQLQQWEKTPGFYKHLQSVFISHDLPVEVRYLAVIQLKNGIDKYWRKTAANAVNKEDKAVIRARLIESGIGELEHRLALQNALVIAKIVRYEYPQDWPDAITNILNAIRASIPDTSSSRLERALLILLHIVKELSTARIQRTRTVLQAATPEIITVLRSIYVNKANQWQNALQASPEESQLTAVLSQSLLSLKIIRRLIITGYQQPHKDNDVRQFWELTLSHLETLLSYTAQGEIRHLGPDLVRLVHRHLLQVSKFHIDMAEKHPAAFVLLPSSLQLVHAYCSTIKNFSGSYASTSIDGATGEVTDDEPTINERLSLAGLLLIKACDQIALQRVPFGKYRTPEEKQEWHQAGTTIKNDLFTQSFVEDVMTILMTKFLVLRLSDLDSWSEDPEDWALRQETESEDMNLSIRACSERLVLSLSTHFKSSLADPILSLFHSVADVRNEEVLFKDAVYAAIGMSAAIFKNEIDFDAILSTTLVPEVQKQMEGAKILRRRIAIFVGQWVVVKISKDSRPLVYQMFDHLLDSNNSTNDLVVRITAGHQFKNVVDDFEFDANQFIPHAAGIITKLMSLIQEVESTATKLGLLETISATIEQFDDEIEPFADAIVNMLPVLWEQSGDEHLMKQSILTVLSRLVRALKHKSGRFHMMLFPIIQNAVQSDSEMQIYLLEEALDLWASILLQTPAPISPELLALVEHLFPFFDLASESLRAALEITESYILLAPQEMLSDTIRKPLLTKLAAIIGPKARAESNGMVCNCVELIIRSASSLGGEDATKQLVSDLVSSEFLVRQMRGLRSAWVAHCTTGPLAKTPAVDGVLETDYFSVLARILLASPSLFVEVVNFVQVGTPIDDENHSDNQRPDPAPTGENIKWLLEEWFSHLENTGNPYKRKLMALALSKLLQNGHPAALAQLQLLMTLWTDLITELCEPDPNAPDAPVGARDTDSFIYTDPKELRSKDGHEPEEPETERKQMLSWNDPVHRLGLPWVVRETLRDAIAACGGEETFREQWLVNVDRDVVAAFGQLGVIS